MKTRRRITQKRSAFTLLELLIVLAIILVIAAMVVPNLLGQQKKAMVKTTKASIAGLESALQHFAADNGGEFPIGGQEIIEELLLPQMDEITGRETDPLLDKSPRDAWGETLYYQYDTSMLRPRIWSSGPDRTNDDGSGDDISSWEDETV